MPYEFERLFASQFVQAMFSLVWSVTALILMRYAARKQERKDEKKQAAAEQAYLAANPPEPVDEELVEAEEALVAE